MFSRAIVIVLDSVGIGELPDAGMYGDEGSNTLGHIAERVPLRLPTLTSLGLANLLALPGIAPPARVDGAYARLAEKSAGKDSVTGHWELMGIVLDRPFPTFPYGFPKELIAEFERLIGRPSMGNVVASGTAIIDELGPRHMETGHPIVYTSADSVFQIAAHEEIVPVPQLYEWCKHAFDIAVRERGLGRVIARPFIGRPGSFSRTANRHDYAMPPKGETLLDVMTAAGQQVTAIGKIGDLFAGRGVSESHPTKSDREGVERVMATMRSQEDGLIFANLVDFDTLYGHRNDTPGYAANLENFDRQLADLIPQLRADDLLVITADHGNDPSTPSTDHSREYVPLLATGPGVRKGVDLGTRSTFADLGQTLAAMFKTTTLAHGVSFLSEIQEG